jgi:hypothetical protein
MKVNGEIKKLVYFTYAFSCLLLQSLVRVPKPYSTPNSREIEQIRTPALWIFVRSCRNDGKCERCLA